MSVSYIIYVSEAARDLGPDDIESILAESRGYNPSKDITGVLLFAEGSGRCRGSFMQLLEGDPEALEHLRQRIFADPRHHTKVVIERGEKPARDFADWSMAFRALAKSDLASHPVFAGLGESGFQKRCAEGEMNGALSFLCDFWEEAA